jgi:hypothetical protein
MTLQEFIKFEEYIRCICIGRDRILPIQYDPTRVGPTGLMRAATSSTRNTSGCRRSCTTA